MTVSPQDTGNRTRSGIVPSMKILLHARAEKGALASVVKLTTPRTIYQMICTNSIDATSRLEDVRAKGTPLVVEQCLNLECVGLSCGTS